MARKSSCFDVLLGLWLGGCLVSCAGPYPSHYSVFIDPHGLTSEQEILIDNALANWQHAVPVTFDEFEGACPDLQWDVETICIHVVSEAEIKQITGPPADFIGWTRMQRGGGESFIWNGLVGDEFQTVTEHELGHAQGLMHTGPGTLMYFMAGSQEASLPTATDIAQWQGLR